MEKKQLKLKLEETIKNINNELADRINGMLKPGILDCDGEELSATYSYAIEEWELNRRDKMHGGIVAAIADNAMGNLVLCVANKGHASTVNLNVNYLRAVPLGGHIIVKSQIDKLGKNLVYAKALGFLSENNKEVFSATGVFSIM